MCRGKPKGSFRCHGQWHSVPQWLQGSFAGTQGTGKHPRLGEGHSLPHTMPPAPHCGMQACYFLLFYQREVAFVIRKNNQSMSLQKKLVSAWIRLHSLAGTLGAALLVARENEGPMPTCTPLLSQVTFGRWKAETGQLTAAVWGLLCAASLHPFLLFWREQNAFYLT